MQDRITRYLDSTGLDYESIEHAPTTSLRQTAQLCQLNLEHIAQALLLTGPKGTLMAVLPLSHIIDLARVETYTALKLAISQPEELLLFKDCAPGAIPPLAVPYGIQAILDSTLLHRDYIYMLSGGYQQILKISGSVFEQLHRYSLQGEISIPITRIHASPSPSKPHNADSSSTLTPITTDGSLQKELIQLSQLPSMPDMALRLLPLHGDPTADFMTLAQVIETDPSLTAQVIRYANSSFFPHHSPITSIGDAIRRSIGFDMTLNLVIAISIGRSITIPHHGPLGLTNFWFNAVLTANISKQIARKVAAIHPIHPDLAYLAGLLHNIGFLLLGHICPRAFKTLNQLINSQPEADVIELETAHQTMTHTEIGGRLLEDWGIPAEVVSTAYHHHQDDYHGDHAIYPAIIRLIQQLIPAFDYRNHSLTPPPTELLDSIGIELHEVEAITSEILQQGDYLSATAKMMAG